jgi:hypothetical protein
MKFVEAIKKSDYKTATIIINDWKYWLCDDGYCDKKQIDKNGKTINGTMTRVLKIPDDFLAIDNWKPVN